MEKPEDNEKYKVGGVGHKTLGDGKGWEKRTGESVWLWGYVKGNPSFWTRGKGSSGNEPQKEVGVFLV